MSISLKAVSYVTYRKEPSKHPPTNMGKSRKPGIQPQKASPVPAASIVLLLRNGLVYIFSTLFLFLNLLNNLVVGFLISAVKKQNGRCYNPQYSWHCGERMLDDCQHCRILLLIRHISEAAQNACQYRSSNRHPYFVP